MGKTTYCFQWEQSFPCIILMKNKNYVAYLKICIKSIRKDGSELSDDDPHYIGSYQHKSNQFLPFFLSQRPRTPVFSRIWSHCNIIGVVPIREFPGVNSQFQGTNHRCMGLRLLFVYSFLALTSWFFSFSW